MSGFDMAHWGWAQFVYAGIIVGLIVFAPATHGVSRSPNNGFVQIFCAVLTAIILWAGGFWE